MLGNREISVVQMYSGTYGRVRAGGLGCHTLTLRLSFRRVITLTGPDDQQETDIAVRSPVDTWMSAKTDVRASLHAFRLLLLLMPGMRVRCGHARFPENAAREQIPLPQRYRCRLPNVPKRFF